MKYCAVVILVFLQSLVLDLHAQSGVDSLLHLLKKEKEDTNKVKLLIELGKQHEGRNAEKAKNYFKEAEELSKKINYGKGIFRSYSWQSDILNQQGLFDEKLALDLEILEWAKKNSDSSDIAISLMNIATSYTLLHEHENAIKYSEEGKNIFARIGNSDYEGQVGDLLQTLYSGLHQYRKAVSYGREAVEKFKLTRDAKSLAYAYNNLGLNYIYLQEYDSAKYFLDQSDVYATQIDNIAMKITNNLNNGYIFLLKGNYDSIKPYIQKALFLSRETKMREYEGLALWGLASYYLGKKEYAIAKKYGDTVLQIANQHNFRDQKLKAFTTLSQVGFAMQDISIGNHYASLAESLRDSILNESITKNTIQIEKKFETEKKESKIKLQQSQLKQKNSLNYLLIASLLLVLSILFLTYRNYKTRRKLQEQRIHDLETEKQLLATQSLLKGQEDERSRLAKDLHDGLGGLLSGVKLQLGAMKGNLILSSENVTAFDRALNKLDESIGEMRRVAHNMMPEALLKLGLQQALSDYCDNLSHNQHFSINCEMHGLDKRMDSTVEVVLYRIVQELLNNAVKHANASAILVQVMRQEDGPVAITVEDNGKGFDPANISNIQTAGIQNIQSRVKYLNGTMDVKSAPGKGTSVYIECKIEKNGDN